MLAVLYSLLGIAGLAYIWVKRRFSYWADRGFLSPPSVFPWGSLKFESNENSCIGIDGIYKKYKGKVPAVGIFFFLEPTIVPLDLELYKNIFVRDFASFHDRGFYYHKEAEPTSANLLTLEGQEWRERRQKMSPIFTSGKMKMMFDIVNTIGDKFVSVVEQNVEKSSVLEMKTFTAKFTSDVIGNVAFGLDCKCLEDLDSKFFKYGKRLFQLTPLEFAKFIFIFAFPNLSHKLHLRQKPKEATDFFLNTFLETLEYREKNNIQRNDFVSLLLNLKGIFTKKELAAESFLVYTGGFETSSILMMFTLYELALNPEIQDRLRAEILENLEENDGKLTYDMLFGMKYLDMVINESLRKYPPIPSHARRSNKDYNIPGTELVIPKGTKIELVTYSLHHDAEYYPEPEKFDPERFTPEMVKARTPFTFIPFGEGPRNCIGMRFGLMQSKLGIVKLIQNFKISPSEKTPIPIRFTDASLFLSPEGDMHLTLKKIA